MQNPIDPLDDPLWNLGVECGGDLECFVRIPDSAAGRLLQVARRVEHFALTGVWADHRTLGRVADVYNSVRLTPQERRRLEDDAMTESWTEAASNTWAFAKGFVTSFCTVGACLPSSQKLAQAMVDHVDFRSDSERGRKILEVGAGTGVITTPLALQKLGDDDRLDIVEFDREFVDVLKQRFSHMPNIRIFHADITRWEPPTGMHYDYILSGLPLAVFPEAKARQIYAKFEQLADRAGKLIYFDYKAIEWKRYLLSGEARRNYEGILNLKESALIQYANTVTSVNWNIPPARVTCLSYRK